MKRKELGPRIVFLEIQLAGEGFDAKLESVKTVGYSSQVFRGDERKILKDLMKVLEDVDLLVTWGGEKSEIPLLTVKAIRHRMNPAILYEVFHFDLKQFFEKTFATQDTEVGKAAEILGLKKRAGKAETISEVFQKLRPVLRVVKPELAL